MALDTFSVNVGREERRHGTVEMKNGEENWGWGKGVDKILESNAETMPYKRYAEYSYTEVEMGVGFPRGEPTKEFLVFSKSIAKQMKPLASL